MLKLISLFVSLLMTAEAPVQQEPETPQAFVQRHAGADSPLSLEEVRAALAELELLVVVQRDLAEADRRFTLLLNLAVKGLERDPPDAEAREVYVLVHEAHIELRVARGMEPDFWRSTPEPSAESSAAE